MYRIIDAHTHIYPDKIAQKALRQIATFYRMDDRIAQPLSLIHISEPTRH